MPDSLPVCSAAANQDPLWIFVDLETHWSADYSIRKLDPPSYILDPRFEAIMMGVAFGNNDPGIIDGPDIGGWLHSLPANVIMVSHNALFDMAILSWRYGYRPRVIVDTVSIARTLLGHVYRHVDLATLAAHYGLAKGDALAKTKGMTRAEIVSSGLWSELAGYCLNDVRVCRTIAMDLIPKLPPEELILHDMVARCAVDPALKLDTGLLAEHHGEILLEKEKVLAHAMRHGLVCKEQLMSNPQFAELLQSKGIVPPMKVSNTTGESTFAFAKKDPQFLELQNHDDPGVQALIEARLTFKSTGEETRTARMLNIATLDFPFHGTGTMPIPLVVGAAHTHRLGGGWQLNAQNWGRTSPIRKAILAPEGYQIVAADSAQIEARMNAWFCGQTDLVEEFRKGEDVYANFASEIYGRRVTKTSDPRARRIGKTGILQLGYQSGALKFKDTLWVDTFSDPDGAVEITDDEAQEVVSTYRSKYRKISRMWRWLHYTAIPILAGEGAYIRSLGKRVTALEFGPVKFSKGLVEGPDLGSGRGLSLYYDDLREEDGQWMSTFGQSKEKLYGGKLLENIIQFLARLVVMSAAVRLKKPLEQYTSRLTHSSHDEIVYIVPNEHVSVVSKMIEQEMTRPPTFAPTLPLACEIGVAVNYGDAK
jgi:DNA polymerase